MAASEVSGLVIEAIQNSVSGVTGCSPPEVVAPAQASKTVQVGLVTAAAMPGMPEATALARRFWRAVRFNWRSS